MSDTPRGLLVTIFRRADGADSTKGGVSSKVTHAILIIPGDQGSRIFDPDDRAPALYLQRWRGFYRAVPVELKPDQHAGYMWGGNFIHSSDGRFPSRHPIPVHDRREEGGR